MPWNKVCIYIIEPYKIHRKRKNTLIVKFINSVNRIKEWFERKQHNNKINDNSELGGNYAAIQVSPLNRYHALSMIGITWSYFIIY